MPDDLFPLPERRLPVSCRSRETGLCRIRLTLAVSPPAMSAPDYRIWIDGQFPGYFNTGQSRLRTRAVTPSEVAQKTMHRQFGVPDLAAGLRVPVPPDRPASARSER